MKKLLIILILLPLGLFLTGQVIDEVDGVAYADIDTFDETSLANGNLNGVEAPSSDFNTAYLHFDGSGTCDIDISDSDYDLLSTDSFSFGFWFRIGTTEAGGTFISKLTGYYSSSTSSYIQFKLYDGTSNIAVQDVTGYYDTTWYCFAAVFNNADNDTMRIYIDGVEANKKFFPTTFAGVNNTTSLKIAGLGAAEFEGALDEIWWHKAAVDSSDIADIYGMSITACGNAASIISGLDSYWRMEEGTGSDFNDTGDLNNDGTINTGATWQSH